MTARKETNRYGRIHPVSFERVMIDNKFWGDILARHRDITIPACLAKCESEGRIVNFRKAAGTLKGEFGVPTGEYSGVYFNDSDVYKVLEGVAYVLAGRKYPALEAQADEIIEIIESAQQADGYLDCYFILSKSETRWTDMERHEDYCLGHMIEAAVAYKNATGKNRFLSVAERMAQNMMENVGPGKKHWVPGHQLIELAMVKLFLATGKEEYLSFAHWLLEERGHGHGIGANLWGVPAWGARYAQDDQPVSQMTDIAGHAVRAMYMYSGMCDVASLTGSDSYMAALGRLWESVVFRNMYVTGGIGSSKINEGFTRDYDLPNDSAYCETCAAAGMVFWNHRMNQVTGDGKYADIVELELYNGVLCGVSLSGTRFFYVNPLESDGTHHRQEWYDVSCCPTQIARLVPSVGNYMYMTAEDQFWVNVYAESDATVTLDGQAIRISQETDYPWDGRVILSLEMEKASEFCLNLRIPGWCRDFSLHLNGVQTRALYTEKGYLKLIRSWSDGDRIELDLAMPVERKTAHPKVMQNSKKIAIQRGPLIYCSEETDNPETFDSLVIAPETRLAPKFRPDLAGGVMTITAETGEYTHTLIPYYAWDNREPGRMKVWLQEK